MRAITTTTALVLAVCALALPAIASASSDYPTSDSVNSIMGSSDSGQVSGSSGDGSGYSSVNSIAPPVPSEPTLVSSPPSSTDDGFEWLSAAIGAAAAMALLALGAAALLTVRRRTTVSA